MMAMKRAATTLFVASSRISSPTTLPSSIFTRNIHASGGKKRIVGVFYGGNEYASLNPNFVGCVEGALGIREWRKSQGHEYIVTDEKEGLNSGLFDKNRIAKCKKGFLIVNNARGAIMDTQAVADACSNGHIAGYSGDVWSQQPAPEDHPWCYMPNHAMTPHISGTTIDAQLRYAAGVKDMLERHFKGEDFPEQNYIVKQGQLASQYRRNRIKERFQSSIFKDDR